MCLDCDNHENSIALRREKFILVPKIINPKEKNKLLSFEIFVELKIPNQKKTKKLIKKKNKKKLIKKKQKKTNRYTFLERLADKLKFTKFTKNSFLYNLLLFVSSSNYLAKITEK